MVRPLATSACEFTGSALTGRVLRPVARSVVVRAYGVVRSRWLARSPVRSDPMNGPLPPPPSDPANRQRSVDFVGAANVGVLVVTAPLASIRINWAMVRIRAAGFEDVGFKVDGDYLQHFNNWYAGNALRVVAYSGRPGSIHFSPMGYAKVTAALAANGWNIYET